MKSLYRKSKTKIGRYMCVMIDENDKILSGSRGWIFVASKDGDRLGVVTITRSGEEKIKYCDIKDLEKAVLSIGHSIGVTKRLFYANNPEARHLDLRKQ